MAEKLFENALGLLDYVRPRRLVACDKRLSIGNHGLLVGLPRNASATKIPGAANPGLQLVRGKLVEADEVEVPQLNQRDQHLEFKREFFQLPVRFHDAHINRILPLWEWPAASTSGRICPFAKAAMRTVILHQLRFLATTFLRRKHA